MAYKFTIHTSKGRPDSLKKSAKIAFTLTPAKSRISEKTYDTVVSWVKNFSANSDQKQSITWGSEFAFARCTIQHGRCNIDSEDLSESVPPGHFTEITRPGGHRDDIEWSVPEAYADHVAAKQLSVIAVNETGRKQRIALTVNDGEDGDDFEPIVAYHVIEDGRRCVAPSELLLQAYVVRNTNIKVGSILQPADTTQALLLEPLSCDSLPLSSTWRLSQNRDGVISLRSNSQSDSASQSIEAKVDELSRSMAEMKAQFSALERSVATAQEGVIIGHQGVLDIRGQLSGIEETLRQSTVNVGAPLVSNSAQTSNIDERLPALETQTEKLAKSFTQTQDYLSSVQKFLQNTSQRIAGLDSKVPLVEAKVEKLAESFNRTQDDFSMAQESLTGLDLRVSVVEGKEEKLQEQLERIQASLEHGSPALFPSRDLDDSLPSVDSVPPLSSHDLPSLPVFGH